MVKLLKHLKLLNMYWIITFKLADRCKNATAARCGQATDARMWERGPPAGGSGERDRVVI